MKLKIKVSYGRVVNLGNYETARIDASISEEIEEKDERNYDKIFEDLFDECEDFVLKKCEIEADKTDEPKNREDDVPF